MDADADNRFSNYNAEMDECSDGVRLSEAAVSGAEILDEFERACEVLKMLELDVACFSERIANLNIFVMFIATKENEFEDYIKDTRVETAEGAMEFSLLSGILDAEVEELESFMKTLQIEFDVAKETVSSWKNFGDTFVAMEKKLHDAEESFRLAEDQIVGIRMQSTNFQRTLSCIGEDENGILNANSGVISKEDDESLNIEANINMQTAEQQRHILRMLDKSLAREIDLEKKLLESKFKEEKLRQGMKTLEQELVHGEEKATEVLGRWLEADNARELLVGISRDLLGKLQISNINGSNKRESELRSEMETSLEQLNTRNKDQLSEITELKAMIVELKEKTSKEEIRAREEEARCKLLEETNTELNQELSLLKSNEAKKVDLLERELRESDIHLQHAVASSEASQEKLTMLYSSIQDMEKLISDLKLKVAKAENRADDAEDKCIILSESNAELNAELSFLRSRLECLEGALHHAEETKMATAKEIAIKTKVITDLLMQLAIERERLSKQLFLLTMENKVLLLKLQQKNDDFVVGGVDKGSNGFCKEELEKLQNDTAACHDEVEPATKVLDDASVRRIDAGVLNYKYMLVAIFVVMVSAAAYILQQNKAPF